jgi:hypothetical protein
MPNKPRKPDKHDAEPTSLPGVPFPVASEGDVMAAYKLAKPEDLPPNEPPPSPTQTEEAVWAIAGDEEVAGVRIKKTAIQFKMEGEVISFFEGVYFVSGPTSGGKSLTGLGLVDYINRLKRSDLRAAYQYVFEEGAPIYSAPTSKGKTTVKSFSDLQSAPFRKPEEYLRNLGASLARIQPRGRPRLLLVSDSLTTAVKFYELKERAGMGTGEKGVQPMDEQFFIDLSALDVLHNVSHICVINPDRLPPGSRWEAITEGLITIHMPGSFTKRDRGGGRGDEQFTVPKDNIDRAAVSLGYPKRPKHGSSVDHPFNKLP